MENTLEGEAHQSQIVPATIRTLAIAATFTAEPLEKSLRFWANQLGLSTTIAFAPLYQVFQQLVDPTGVLATNTSGANILLIRPEDWLRYLATEHDWATTQATVEHTRADFVGLVSQFAEQSAVPLLIALCPPSMLAQAEPQRIALLQEIDARLAEELSALPQVTLIRADDLLAQYPVTQYDDPYGDELGQIPYTEEFFTALGTRLARTIHALYAPPTKVIAVDCDNTLWAGVCGEDGPQGVRIEAGHQALQAFLVAQHKAGTLICLCSKNELADVEAVFATRNDMLLGSEHLSLWLVNWEAKSHNLRQIANTLELGVDSILLLDDNPIECAEVAANCPEAVVLQVPAPDQLATFVQHLWPTDRVRVTNDDRERAQRYRQQAERERFRQTANNLQAFVDGLELSVDIEPLATEHLDRAAQLTQRTNQFNLTTIRRTSSELARLIADDQVDCQVVHVRDRFGDYGLVGVLIARQEGSHLRIDTFLLSCRTLGRGVEHKMLAWLGRAAEQHGLESVVLPFIPTAKNTPARLFLEQIAGQATNAPGAELRFVLDSSVAAQVRYLPDIHHTNVAPSERTTATTNIAKRSAVFQQIANELITVEQINAAIRQAQLAQTPDLRVSSAFTAPQNDTEQIVADMWADLLGLERVSTDAQFFDIGGHSLRLVQFMVRVREEFGVELPMQTLITGSFTVADAAQLIERCRIEQANEDDLADLLNQLEGLSDEDIAALLAEQA